MINLKYYKSIYLAVLLMTVGFYKCQLSQAQNFVYSKTYLEPVTTSSSTAKGIEAVTYFDGLGRPKQSIAIKGGGTSSFDLVTPFVYDDYGRQRIDVLPIPIATSNQSFQPGITETSGSSFYGARAYAEKILESSPLDRIEKQIQPGADWQSHPVDFKYQINSSTDVLKFTATSFPDKGIFYISQLKVDGFYASSKLYKNRVADEDGGTTYEFKNGKGQLLMVRKVLGNEVNVVQQQGRPLPQAEYLDTYYVYNEYNQLSFVIPPLASREFRNNSTQTINDPGVIQNDILDNLCYQYRYDGKSRLAEKKLPGKGWEFLVYDKSDRLVMSQDTDLAIQGKWLITKYDRFDRVLCTGFHPYGNREQAQNLLKDMVITEERDGTGYLQNGLQIYYNRTYFVGMETYLSVNYYDTYPPDTPFPDDNKILLEPILTDAYNSLGRSVKSFPLASFVKNIDDDSWTKNFTFFDSKGRSIGSTSINHLGGSTIANSKLDFAGVVQQAETLHNRISSENPVQILEDFTYDHQNRLKKHFHEVVGKTEKELLTENVYDDLGRLDTKSVGAVSNSSFGLVSPALQTIKYSYNIRGWITGINLNPSGNLDTTKLFSYKLKYNNPDNIYIKNYNGNIAEMDWTYGSNAINRYEYNYDQLNRLLKANFKSLNGSTTSDSEYFNEELSYDLNGNIKTLKRNARPQTGLTATQVDNLTYYYENNELSNRLQRITDNEGFPANNPSGYPGGGGINTYDANGNLLTMPDKNITTPIVYNFLNLPQVVIKNGQPVTYSYRADGAKIHKLFEVNGQNIHTDYLDGFVYTTPYTLRLQEALTASAAAEEMSTAGQKEAFELEDKPIVANPEPVLKTESTPNFFPTAEGFYDYDNFKYIYQYRDHLGNTRLSYGRNENGQLIAENGNDYYPFGLNFINPISKGGAAQVYNPSATYKNYKYNGKELQETGMYDYGARFYMPDIGRWGVVDPLAEKYTRWSPYNYAVNNPIINIDPDGRSVESLNETYKGFEAQEAFRRLQKQVAKNKPPDDIFLSKDGKVSTIFRNNQPNRFFDLSNGNKELTFNDPKGVNSSFLKRKFNVGDKIYYPVSNKDMMSAVKNVGSNSAILGARALHQLSGNNAVGSLALTASYAMIASESRGGNADFSAHYLSNVIGEENGKYVYENDSSYNIRFGNSNKMYSLMDAGNFMWGVWSAYIGLTNAEVKIGSNLNETLSGFDTEADQTAIFDGRKTKLK